MVKKKAKAARRALEEAAAVVETPRAARERRLKKRRKSEDIAEAEVPVVQVPLPGKPSSKKRRRTSEEDVHEEVSDKRAKKVAVPAVEEDESEESSANGRGGKGDKGKGKGKDKGKGKEKGKGKGKEGKGTGSGKKWSNPEFRVFVHNISRAIDEDLLKKDFSECGEVLDVYMPKNGHTEGHRGFAFITYENMDGVEEALKYHGDEYAGNTLKVQRAAEKGKKEQESSTNKRSARPEGATSIVVKRLSLDVTKADLEDFFGECGAGPTHVGLLTDKAGRSRCTARIDFKTEADVDEAMMMSTELRGRSFFMDYCVPKQW